MMANNRDILNAIVSDLSDLADKQTNQLVAIGPPTDGGTIETQRGVVLGLRMALDSVIKSFKETEHV